MISFETEKSQVSGQFKANPRMPPHAGHRTEKRKAISKRISRGKHAKARNANIECIAPSLKKIAVIGIRTINATI